MHIHIGYDNPDKETNFNIIKQMDLYLGVPSIILDTHAERRQLYGKAGCFRHKKYGVEFRTLSNFWLFSPELILWAATNSLIAASNFKTIDDQDLIISCINDNNVELARHLVNKYSVPMPLDRIEIKGLVYHDNKVYQ